MTVLARGAFRDMRWSLQALGDVAPHRSRCHVYTAAQPVGPVVGSSSGTSSPGEERETACCELESQLKSSRNFMPCSQRGLRTQISSRTFMSAPSTPTAKKQNDFFFSPS